MATLDYYSVAAIIKGRIFSSSRVNTWDSTTSTMRAHASVSNYGTDGVLTPSSASNPAGTTPETKYTFTIPSGLPDGDYLLAAFEATPAIGGYATVEPGLLGFNFHDGAVTTLEGLQDAIDAGGGGGGGDVIVTPITVTTVQNAKPVVELTVKRGSNETLQLTLLNQDAGPTDFSGHDISLDVFTLLGTTEVFSCACEVTGDGGNIFIVTVVGTDTQAAIDSYHDGTMRHELWDNTAGTELAYGAFEIKI
jgi:hypothetical protein